MHYWSSIHRSITLTSSILLSSFSLFNCGGAPTTLSTNGGAIIQGKVVEESNLRAIGDVLVTTTSNATGSATTNSDGTYQMEVVLADSVARTITLKFTKSGYLEESVGGIIIQNNVVTPVPELKLSPSGTTSPTTSGDASNVILVGVEFTDVFVKGSGGNETTDLTFEVQDEHGVPVDLEHRAKVCFRIEAGPDAGEFLSPDSVETDNAGRVVVTLNSGNATGTVQIVAEIPETTIKSAPVPISINGWLPDEAHFSIACQQLNFPGWIQYGLFNNMTAYIGDKFSNPVPPGTSVTFSTTGGIIEGSSVTDDIGTATVRLMSAEPLPQGININALHISDAEKNAMRAATPYFQGKGYAHITAQTVDENSQKIYADHIVLFSGGATINNVSPTSFDTRGASGSQSFTFTVADINGNPLTAGTNISITAKPGQIAGGPAGPLSDTLYRGTGTTEFSFTYLEPDALDEVKDVVIDIKVTGQNGNVATSISGLIGP